MKVILHVRIPGEPIAQKRHRFGGHRSGRGWHNYDPNEKDKENFQWQLKAAAPRLAKIENTRLAIIIEIWSAKPPVQKRINRQPTGKFHYETDWDNYGKFYCDALTGMAWDDDCWIEDGRVILHRHASVPAVDILVWELEDVPVSKTVRTEGS
jgi:Holliday junction resolvase RusA-like endonuclease